MSFLVSVVHYLWNPFFLSFFADFQLCFLFNINAFGFKKHKLKNTNFWSEGGLQQNVFFITCVLQNVKSYRFFCPFLATPNLAQIITLQHIYIYIYIYLYLYIYIHAYRDGGLDTSSPFIGQSFDALFFFEPFWRNNDISQKTSQNQSIGWTPARGRAPMLYNIRPALLTLRGADIDLRNSVAKRYFWEGHFLPKAVFLEVFSWPQMPSWRCVVSIDEHYLCYTSSSDRKTCLHILWICNLFGEDYKEPQHNINEKKTQSQQQQAQQKVQPLHHITQQKQ